MEIAKMKYKLREYKQKIKDAYYRAKNGWCPSDAYSFDYWFCNTAPKILNRLANDSQGFSIDDRLEKYQQMFPEIEFEKINYDDSGEDVIEKHFRNWKRIIEALAYLIQNSSEFTKDETNPLYKNEFEIELREKEICELVEKNRKRAFDILKEMLPDLWW